MTNRERIDNMSNVELSKFITKTFIVTCMENACAFRFDDSCGNKDCCAKGVLRWLESEVEE